MPTENTFDRELARLNPAQRAAVDQIEGPVMVLAGPGTGKTHLLSARIGNILRQTDTSANSILCLTYTEAGVKAMRERLLQWIGPEAYRVAIHTFHGFCSQVIRDHLEYFGRRDLEPLSDLERVRAVRDILENLDAHHPLRAGRSNAYFYERQLSRLFSAMKAEDWTSAGLEMAVDDYLSRLSEYPDFVYKRKFRSFKKGDIKEAKAAEERIKMERLKAGAQLFHAFNQKLADSNRYDYDDMIRWVLQAFREHQHLLRLYQERFLYILVDEFQDTNGSQEEIVRLLASYWDSPNLFIVGDDDQSIYEFQGARLKSMLDFYERYDGVEVITLRENYRSDQILLDTAAYLIDQNEQRLSKLIDELSIDKHLLSASGESGFKPQIRHYANADQELMAVVNQIHSWREQGVGYGQMAVIYARHQQADLLKQLLERSGIPYQTKRRPNVLDTLSIRQLRELLTYLDLEDRLPGSGQHLLFRILHFGCFGLEASDLALLALARRRPEVQDAAETWCVFLSRPDLWPAGIQAANNVQQVAATLERLQAELHQQPLARFIDTVLSQSGMLAYYAKKTDRLMRLLELRTFVAFLERECLRQPRTDLRKFLSTLSGMDANRIEMPLLALSENTQAVQLLTAHSAKGLEFDYVWMYDCVEKQWGEGRSANNQRFKLPPTITYSGEEDALEAKRRLFYVAMTRSKKELVMSYASQNQAGKPVQAVQFLIAMIKELGISGEVLDQGGFDLAAYLGVQLGLDRVRIEPPVKTDLIGEFLKDFRVSVSALHTWLDCPLAFFYERVLQLPRIQRPAAVYGESLHEALQNYFLIVRDENQEGWPSKEKLVSLFERALAKRRAWLETRDYNEYLRRGRRELATYFDHERSNWMSSVSVEQYIGHVDIEGVPAVAVIDRIDHIAKNRVAIVDYKTGFANQRHTRPPSDGKPAGGAYWRQLVFYKMIFEAHERGLVDVESCSLSYLTIGPDGQQAKVEMKVKQKDEQKMRAIINDAYEKIMTQQFYEGCGKETCSWCQFVRDQQGAIPDSDEDLSGLDETV